MNSTDGGRIERVVMTRLVRLADADRSFDLEFWQAVDDETRLAVAWQMVKEARLVRGEDGDEPDYRDLLRELNSAGARFLVVGAYGLAESRREHLRWRSSDWKT